MPVFSAPRLTMLERAIAKDHSVRLSVSLSVTLSLCSTPRLFKILKYFCTVRCF